MVQLVESANSAISAYLNGTLSPAAAIIVSDTAINIQTDLDYLQPLVAAGDVTSVIMTTGTIPILNVTAAQAITDGGTIKDITGPFSLFDTVQAPNSHIITGALNALGNLVIYTGPASLYSITAAGDGVNFTVTGGLGTDHLSNIQALQFSTNTEIVATAPGVGSVVTSGNIAEIYGAVMNRTPDAAAMGFYESILATVPNTSLINYAQWFVNSPEYLAAHSYAQTIAGDAQFITDNYTHLLGRTASAAEIGFYQNAVIAPFLVGLTPGSAAYGQAEMLAHASVLTDFSQSAEFLSNIQVTGTHPGDAQHYLVLI